MKAFSEWSIKKYSNGGKPEPSPREISAEASELSFSISVNVMKRKTEVKPIHSILTLKDSHNHIITTECDTDVLICNCDVLLSISSMAHIAWNTSSSVQDRTGITFNTQQDTDQSTAVTLHILVSILLILQVSTAKRSKPQSTCDQKRPSVFPKQNAKM